MVSHRRVSGPASDMEDIEGGAACCMVRYSSPNIIDIKKIC